VGKGCEAEGLAGRTFAFGFFDQVAGQLAGRLKIRSARHLARPLAALLVGGMAKSGVLDDLQGKRVAIVPVPTAKSRKRERGIDHTRLVAKELARIMGWGLCEVLERKNEGMQRGRTKAERLKQAKGLFALKSGKKWAFDTVKSEHDTVNAAGDTVFDTVILYDDITTTGATLAECVKALEKSGVKDVRCVVLAKTR
jgi:ComF family protein